MGVAMHQVWCLNEYSEDNLGLSCTKDGLIRLPTILHEAVNAEYAKSLQDGTGMTIYQWLQTQPYEVQREEGLKILRRLNIVK